MKLQQLQIFVMMAAAVCSGYGNILAAKAKSQPAISGQVTSEGKPMAGVQVSDGVEIVKTDANGYYSIAKSDKTDGTVYITTPSGYIALSNDGFQPGFWRLLTADAKTPEVHNFELKPENQDTYSILFVTDLHLTNDFDKQDLNAFETEALPTINKLTDKYSKKGPVYCMNLGDLSHDMFWYRFDFPLDKVKNYLIKNNWPLMTYSVSGNHDNDGAIVGEDVDNRAAWLYRKTMGPAQYSVNIGNDHWIMMDNIQYKNIEGQGKKSPGIKGDRSYTCAFTPAQLEWMKKDIANMAPGMRVRLCCHAPLLFNNRKNGMLYSKEAMDLTDEVFKNIDHVTVYSGHAHQLDYSTHPDYPRFEQFVGPCSSGNMWTTSKDYQTISTDGTEAGVFVSTFTGNEPEDRQFYTYVNGQRPMRVYDLNGVGEYYRNDPTIQRQLALYPNRPNYGDEKFRNMVLVNYWLYKPGQKVEIIENGKPLEVTKVINLEDPLYNISYYAPLGVELGTYKASYDNIKNYHMFKATATTADAPLEIRITDANGKVLFLELVNRPKTFDINAK